MTIICWNFNYVVSYLSCSAGSFLFLVLLEKPKEERVTCDVPDIWSLIMSELSHGSISPVGMHANTSGKGHGADSEVYCRVYGVQSMAASTLSAVSLYSLCVLLSPATNRRFFCRRLEHQNHVSSSHWNRK